MRLGEQQFQQLWMLSSLQQFCYILNLWLQKEVKMCFFPHSQGFSLLLYCTPRDLLSHAAHALSVGILSSSPIRFFSTLGGGTLEKLPWSAKAGRRWDLRDEVDLVNLTWMEWSIFSLSLSQLFNINVRLLRILSCGRTSQWAWTGATWKASKTSKGWIFKWYQLKLVTGLMFV